MNRRLGLFLGCGGAVLTRCTIVEVELVVVELDAVVATGGSRKRVL